MLVEKISNYFVDKVIFKDEKPNEEEREITLFGVTRIVEDVPKYLAIFIISLILGILKEVGVVLVVVLIYKTFIGGAHARTNIGCFIFSAIFFITPSYISKYMEINNITFNILLAIVNLFSIYVVLRYAPADTEEVPILNKKKRKMMQIFAFISQILIDISLFTFVKDEIIRKIILVAVFYCDLMTTNIIYKLLKSVRSRDSEEFKNDY